MNEKDLIEMMQSTEVFVEALSGLRNALIAQGFSEQAAEMICLQALTKASEK